MSKLLVSSVMLILVASGLARSVHSQACSCGGAPLTNSLELPTSPIGVWQFGITYQYNSISDVVEGSDRLDDDTRTRSVHAGLMEISYGLTNRFTVSGVFTLLQQERTSQAGDGAGEFLRTRGIGDALFLLKYSLVPYSVQTQRQVAVGGGVKAPFGESSLRSNNILIAADMQPGSGAWDAVLWAYFSQGLYRHLPVGVTAAASYRFTGANDRFGPSSESYNFGDELVATLSANYRLFAKTDLIAGLRYRSLTADQFADQELPNSGGRWLNLTPGLSYEVSNSVFARVAGELPLYRKLDGIQLTTDYSLSLALFFKFGGKQASQSWNF